MELNIDQRAYVVGDQGICPECEQEVDWNDIDTNWYLCHACVEALVGTGWEATAREWTRADR